MSAPANGREIRGDAEFFEMSLDHLCVAGFDGYWKRLNPSWSRTLGWTDTELMAVPLIDFVHPEDREAVLAARQGLTHGIPLLTLANRYRCKDGTYRWFEWRSVADTQRGLVYAIARDVTAEKTAQDELRELTESLAATLNSIADGLITIDPAGAITRMNPVAEQLTGWAADAARGRPLGDVFALVDGDPAMLVARDGSERPIAVHRTPLRANGGEIGGAVIAFRDLTAERESRAVQDRLQRQLMMADRMASVGTLAAGVAHEINNPLAYVMSNLELLAEEIKTLSDGPLAARAAEWAEMAAEAHDGAERIRKIVRGLMTFARGQDERRTLVEIPRVLELACNLVANEIRHRARLIKDYGACPHVEADEARLAQVFINLLVNAAQAIPEGDADGNEIRIASFTDETGRAVIEVRDSGPGIPAEALPRVFDPFFTTKPIGVGTGLGLSICHNVVRSIGGQISAANREGGGACFRVTLPAAARSPAVAPAAPARARGEDARRLAVLVIDDERSVGVTLARLLRDHDVTATTSAREALALIAGGRAFDLVLSDLMMPEMSGMELYDELARHHPHIAPRVVFITGGAFTDAAKAFLERVSNERLDKPFSLADVRALVARRAK